MVKMVLKVYSSRKSSNSTAARLLGHSKNVSEKSILRKIKKLLQNYKETAKNVPKSSPMANLESRPVKKQQEHQK